LKNAANFRKTSASTQAGFHGFASQSFTVREAAGILGKSEDTIARWCKQGKLIAVPERFGSKNTYRIPALAIEQLRLAEEQAKETVHRLTVPETKAKQKGMDSHLEKFAKVCRQGMLDGHAFSERTVTDYLFYLRKFLIRHVSVNVRTLEADLLDIPVQHFAKREKLYKAVVCFGKFLVKEKLLDKAQLDEMKALAPRRHIEAKRSTLTEAQLETALEGCRDSLKDTLTLTLLAKTGIRASEFCALQKRDLSLTEGTLQVRLGKGGKSRSVGLTASLSASFTRYLAEAYLIGDEAWLFPARSGAQMDRHGLARRLQRIGKQAGGLHISPHMLRRAFVTINANKGRSLVMLQHSCGHTNITTTRGYCRTTEQEVIEAMKSWE
jgi:site-specific recombinase XerD